MANKIQLRRGTKALLNSLGPLALGEPGYITDTRELVIGNGTGANTPVVTATSADITYYVRTDGSDSNTGLVNSAGGAFKTIGKAVSMIPQVVNHVVNINIGAGTYAEVISLKGFVGEGNLTITGDTSTRTVQNIEIYNCTIVTTVSGFTCSTTSAAAVTIVSSTGAVLNQVNSIVNATSQPGVVLNLAVARISSCVISNKLRVVDGVNGAKAYIENISGTGNGAGYYAQLGSHLSYAGTQATSTAGNVATSGGTVNSDLLNPWGDNTLSQRSFISAARTGTKQVLLASTWTTLIMNTEYVDNLSEYNPATGAFTAKSAGLYLMHIKVDALGVVGGTHFYARSLQNGSLENRFAAATNYGTIADEMSMEGSITVALSAGDSLAVQMFSSSGVTLEWESTNARIVIVKIA